MNSTRTDMKAVFMLAVLPAAALLAAPAHAGLLGNGSFEALVIADGANCPGVPLGKSCVDGVGAKQQPDGSEVAGLYFKGAEKGAVGGDAEAAPELTVAFVRDSFGAAAASQGSLDAVGLMCAANPEVCRDKVYGAPGAGISAGAGTGAGSAVGSGSGSGSGSASGGASSVFALGFMQSVGGVQVSPQYGLSFLQGSTPTSARSGGGDSAGSAGSAVGQERWEVTYGASSQPAAAVAQLEGSSGWSSGSLQFQGTSATQVQTYMASGPSGLMGNGAQVSPTNGMGWNLGPGTTSVPEPSVLLLVGAALAGLWVQRRRQSVQS